MTPLFKTKTMFHQTLHKSKGVTGKSQVELPVFPVKLPSVS